MRVLACVPATGVKRKRTEGDVGVGKGQMEKKKKAEKAEDVVTLV